MGATVEITSNSQSGGLARFIQKLKRNKQYLVTGFFTPEQASIATTLEYGAHIRVTDKMRGYFGAVFGVHLKKDTQEIVIPARPFMQRTIEEHGDEWVLKVAQLAKLHHYDMKKVFDIMGEIVMNDLKTVMQSGDFIENSAITLAHKQGSKPLIDTGDLRDSIAYDTRTE